MSALIYVLFACGGTPVVPDAPEAKLEDYMRTCMGSGDCVVVPTGCCGQGAVAVNKSNAEHVRAQALDAQACAAVTCPASKLPTATCTSAKCVLVP